MNFQPTEGANCKPLRERLPAWDADAERAIDLSVHCSVRSGQGVSRWASPFFSRLGLDCPIPESLVSMLERARVETGLGLYLPGEATASLHSIRAGEGVAIVPIPIDEPLVPRTVRHARHVEFQLMPSLSSEAGRGAERKRWTPTMPSDLMRPEQLRDRVDWVRHVSAQENLMVGGAIPAAAVYDDVQFLIECGFDYACILADGICGIHPEQRVSFMDPNAAVELSMRAVADSGRSDFSLMLASTMCHPNLLVGWLQAGIRAVGIDGCFQSKAPESTGRKGEGFGGFLGDYTPPGDRTSDWIGGTARGVCNELANAVIFAGHASWEAMRTLPSLRSSRSS
jgi:hypothetical protein